MGCLEHAVGTVGTVGGLGCLKYAFIVVCAVSCVVAHETAMCTSSILTCGVSSSPLLSLLLFLSLPAAFLFIVLVEGASSWGTCGGAPSATSTSSVSCFNRLFRVVNRSFVYHACVSVC